MYLTVCDSSKGSSNSSSGGGGTYAAAIRTTEQLARLNVCPVATAEKRANSNHWHGNSSVLAYLIGPILAGHVAARGPLVNLFSRCYGNTPLGQTNMAVPAQPLEGFFFDELSKVRVVEPETAEQTQELKEECKDFVESK